MIAKRKSIFGMKWISEQTDIVFQSKNVCVYSPLVVQMCFHNLTLVYFKAQPDTNCHLAIFPDLPLMTIFWRATWKVFFSPLSYFNAETFTREYCTSCLAALWLLPLPKCAPSHLASQKKYSLIKIVTKSLLGHTVLRTTFSFTIHRTKEHPSNSCPLYNLDYLKSERLIREP